MKRKIIEPKNLDILRNTVINEGERMQTENKNTEAYLDNGKNNDKDNEDM